MSDSGESKYKWTPESTSLLVSIWTDKQVQKKLDYCTKPQVIWESVARYMNKKGYYVNGKQCRSRMKQVLVCYREAKRAGTKEGVEQYYESIDQVLKLKKLENYNNNNGIDTVDSTADIKSPPKDVKTNKNIQMRFKYQQPPESIYRTEALSPVWSGRDQQDYPDSPESNETVLAQPYRVLSPVKDAATNTTQHQIGGANSMNKKVLQQNGFYEEAPIKETLSQRSSYANYFSEIPFQNTVQNVQNQIIQENMQQSQAILQQNLLQNQLFEQNRMQQLNPIFRQNTIQNMSQQQQIYSDQGTQQFGQSHQMNLGQNMMADNVLRVQNKTQLNSINNRAVPQEPRKAGFRQNLAATHRQFQDMGRDIGPQTYHFNMNQLGFFSPSISPDIPPNLNEAFCQQTKSNGGIHPNHLNLPNNADVTTLTNNATFNDDSISIEFLQEDSPTPENDPTKLKDLAINTDEIPNAPLRKKKAEKLEKLMISAINSQTEVVNKILAAQNEMVSRVLDLDRDRQNRLENRLDHLLDVVQTAVLNKSSPEKVSGGTPPPPPPPSEPFITNLVPPPKPGVMPPKLDLVPPKPCRVPCTSSTANNQAVNHCRSPELTRPGVVSPISPMSPTKKVGAIWQKLGPVSTSPFVRAQQQLGFKPVNPVSNDVRTQSSAERRIAKELENGMDAKTVMFETENFLEAERQIQEKTENARIKSSMGQDLQARRRLFSQREPNAAMILTAAFLDAEIQSTEIIENARLQWLRQKQRDHEREMYNYIDYNSNNQLKRNAEMILSGQGESYERLKQLNERERAIGNPNDSSTPAKMTQQIRDHATSDEPRPTIQQLAQLVMNSARWRNPTGNNLENMRKTLNLRPESGNNLPCAPHQNEEPVTLRHSREKEFIPDNRLRCENKQSLQTTDGRAKTLEWLQDRYSYGGQQNVKSHNNNNNNNNNTAPRLSLNEPNKTERPIGFTTQFINRPENLDNIRRQNAVDQEKHVGFVLQNDFVSIDNNKLNHFASSEDKDPFAELHQMYLQKQLKIHQSQGLPFMIHNGKIILAQGDMIERYVKDMNPKNQHKESDSDNDEEFLDTTASMPSTRKNSLTSIGTKSGKSDSGCILS